MRPFFAHGGTISIREFVVGALRNVKRHDVGPGFYERTYDGQTRTQFIITPLWGVGSTPPYGHDGRSINLTEVAAVQRPDYRGVARHAS